MAYREYDELSIDEQDIVNKEFLKNKEISHYNYTFLVTSHGLIDLKSKIIKKIKPVIKSIVKNDNVDIPTTKHKGRGRPKGSKNKHKMEDI